MTPDPKTSPHAKIDPSPRHTRINKIFYYSKCPKAMLVQFEIKIKNVILTYNRDDGSSAKGNNIINQ